MQNNLIFKIDRRIEKILLQRSATSRQECNKKLVIREMQTRTTPDTASFSLRQPWTKQKKRKQIPLGSNNYWQDWREIEMYTMLVGVENNRAAMENRMTALQKIKVNYCMI